jgi:hypothetical protein
VSDNYFSAGGLVNRIWWTRIFVLLAGKIVMRSEFVRSEAERWKAVI